MWDFGNNLNWDLVLRQTYYAQSAGLNDPNIFLPIPAVTRTVDSHTLIIGTRNSQAKANWYLAGYATCRLLFTPSSTSDFVAAVQSRSVRLGLNRLNLVQFTDFNLLPYLLEINISRWHREMMLEVWKYSGIHPINLAAIKADLEAIIARMN